MHGPDFEDDYDEYEYDDEPELPRERRRDPKTDEAKVVLAGLFAGQPDRVFYGRQLEVLLEGQFFHWITTRAAAELAREGRIATIVVPLMRRFHGNVVAEPGEPTIRFLWSIRNRYWRRAAETVRSLVAEFSVLGRALGVHGEQMFDAALPRAGFMPRAWNVREWEGRIWTQTGHDLDRVFVRDGVAYGAEIKNTLDYIDRNELRVKVRMCTALGLRPLFIVRMAPKSYVEEVRRAGSFTLIFGYQLYPHGHADLARRIREGLRLPTDAPAALAEGTVQRFVRWHVGTLSL